MGAVALTLPLAGAGEAPGQRAEPGRSAPRVVRAERSAALTATLGRAIPLAPGAAGGRPAVTGGSGLARLGGWTYVAQDDSTHLAAISDSAAARVETVRLFEPAGGADRFHDAFGNKAVKPDTEAVAVVSVPRRAAAALAGEVTRAPSVEALLVVGSGSIPGYRDRIAVVFPGAHPSSSRVAAIRPRALYARLRADERLTGGGVLNVEAVAVTDGGATVRLFNRGNGPEGSVTASVDVAADALVDYLARAATDPDAPFDAPFANATRYELGASGAVPISVGDVSAVHVGRGARRRELLVGAFVAERTNDPTKDGPTSATSLGLQLADGTLLIAPVLEAGRPSSLKIEGLVVRRVASSGPADSPARLAIELVGIVDTDPDDPGVPSTLVELSLVYAPDRKK